jgi:transcriptional regulator with XRE-family HTH domain
MDHERVGFGEFLVERLKDKGMSLKRIADLTGIAPSHIESLLRDEFGNLPSAPYLRGYLMRLGKALDFDGESWWITLKKEGVVKNSGDLDTLPENRFEKQSPPKFIWFIIFTVIIIGYLAFQLPHIIGKPSLTITFPGENPYSTASSTMTITGTVRNADSLSLNGDPIIIPNDGSWQKGVLLQAGPNSFIIAAKKFLGGETDITEQILYEPAVVTSSTPTHG